MPSVFDVKVTLILVNPIPETSAATRFCVIASLNVSDKGAIVGEGVGKAVGVTEGEGLNVTIGCSDGEAEAADEAEGEGEAGDTGGLRLK
jgi:hypothetical protein